MRSLRTIQTLRGGIFADHDSGWHLERQILAARRRDRFSGAPWLRLERFGQFDNNCVDLTSTAGNSDYRVGGGFGAGIYSDPTAMRSTSRKSFTFTNHDPGMGARCARPL